VIYGAELIEEKEKNRAKKFNMDHSIIVKSNNWQTLQVRQRKTLHWNLRRHDLKLKRTTWV
jgi:cell envelope opacity-associated protein A